MDVFASNRAEMKSAGWQLSEYGGEGYVSATVVKSDRESCLVEMEVPSIGKVQLPIPAYRISGAFRLGEILDVYIRAYNFDGHRYVQNVQFIHVESEDDPTGERTNVNIYPISVG